MISRSLVLVLLSAIYAITTPNTITISAEQTRSLAVVTTPTNIKNLTGDISYSRNATFITTLGPRTSSEDLHRKLTNVDNEQQVSNTSIKDVRTDLSRDEHDHLESLKISKNSSGPIRLVETIPLKDHRSSSDQKEALESARTYSNQQQPKVYTNQFVIEVKGGEEEARRLAEKHGFVYLNHILGDFYHLEHRRLARRSLDTLDMNDLDVSIEQEPHVLKIERQVLKKRVKRDFIDLGSQAHISESLGASWAQQKQQNQQQQQQVQLNTAKKQQRPNAAGRSAQFLRPANQPPGSLSVAYNQQQALPTQSSPNSMSTSYLQLENRRLGVGQPHVPATSLMPSTGQASSLRLTPAQQHYLDQLEMTSSGPAPFFLRANFSNQNQNHSHQQSQANVNALHRPPPPPLQANELLHNYQPHNQNTTSSQFQHLANETLKPVPFNDPSWPLMWYLDGGARSGFDLNVQAAWKMGYTGKGIVITILDDGLEKDHPDLQANYDPLASFDINNDDADPMPRYDANDSNRHGTRCAGEVAAVPDNNICSIGIAYNSKVGGVRMLDGEVTDAVEARSLGLNNQHIHIYSASWGPDDNGKTVDGPGELATRAFIDGVTNGRQGLGSIFVFASGNGGREHDNCNCDGYTNSIWTLSISSATENGYVPWYIEACSSTLATTYSSGSYDERQITTTDIRHSCTNNHTGTSASAPIAAGICALVLESNPRLTWRDMQHIVVRTAKPANLIAKDWRTNAMGRNVSHAFGYGLMDAAAMITTAKRWTTVPMQYTCQVSSPQMEKYIPAKGHIELKLRAECANVRFLEHVQSKVTLNASRRGDLHIYLTSPSGTRSTLLAQRPNDQAEQGFRNWPFMTVHNWGESPNGVWTLEVHNDGKPQNRALFKEWTLMLYGTYDDPNKHLDVAASSAPTRTSPSGQSSSVAQKSATTNTRPPATPSRIQAGQNPPSPSFSPDNSDQTSAGVQVITTTMATSSGKTQQQHLQPKKPIMVSQNHPQAPLQSSNPPPPISSSNKPDLLESGVTTTSERPASKLNSKTMPVINTQQAQTTPTIMPTLKQSSPTNDGRLIEAQTLEPPNSVGADKELSQTIKPNKADFSVVSAQSGPDRVQSFFSSSNQQPMDPVNSTDLTGVSVDNDKHQVHIVDNNNRIEAPHQQHSAANMKPSVEAVDDRQQQTGKQQQGELDNNQLDSKLSKDYRSSGGQDTLQHDRQRPDSHLNNEHLTDGASLSEPSKHRNDAAASASLVCANNFLLVYANVVLVLSMTIFGDMRRTQLQMIR